MDRLGSLGMRRGRKRRGSCRPEPTRPREPSSPKGAVPWGTPGSPPRPRGPGQGRRSSLTSGLKLLWAEPREASAAASASRGSSRLRAGRAAGDMVRGRPGRAACGSAAGPKPGGRAATPSDAFVFGRPRVWVLRGLSARRRGSGSRERLPARRLSSVFRSFFCLVGGLDGEPSLALCSGPSLYPTASPPAHAPMPSFPGADVVVSA